MPRLSISLFGPLEVTLDGELVTGFESDKVRALLSYLAAETEAPQRRERLAGLLWPDQPEQSARANLSHVLANLRTAIADRTATPPFLQITRQTIHFNRGSDAWVDVSAFTDLLQPSQPAHQQPIHRLEETVALYRGEFLAGFSLPGCPAFEEWMLLERERLRRLVLEILGRLSDWHEKQGNVGRALEYAWRQVELDPLLEAAHRQLMRLLVYSGQRGTALNQYETCCQVLADELGVKPEQETMALYEQIRAGELESAVPAGRGIRGYELGERISAGDFSEIYRAFQPAVGREVAIKVILPQYSNQPRFVRRFEREARLVARLEHPHIVPLYDYWREPSGAYLVMRWLPGGTLQESLHTRPWSEEAAAGLLEQVADALALAHRQGVIHRDVKPQNILLDGEGNAYLTDFGIAKDLLRIISTLTHGTPRSLLYISPELAQGQELTTRSDLYSLGIVMYEVLTGEHPFAGLPPAAQLMKNLSEPLPPLRARRPELPEALEGVIQRATAKDPAERYPDAVAFATAFRQAALAPAEGVAGPMPDGAPG